LYVRNDLHIKLVKLQSIWKPGTEFAEIRIVVLCGPILRGCVKCCSPSICPSVCPEPTIFSR